MTATVLGGICLALLASLGLNGGYLLQHGGSRATAPVSARRPVASLAGLLRSRLWLAGAAAGVLGWTLHIGALSLAPLSLVQAFSAGGLALVVPLATRVAGVGLASRDRRAVLLMGGALALLGVGAGRATAAGVPALALGLYALGAGVVAAALAVASSGARRGEALGLAAGVLYGVGDAATKALTSVAHAGPATAALSPWVAVVVVASIAAFFAFQRGLQIGPAVPVIALMTAATNGVAIVAGLAVFGDSLGESAAYAALHAGALLAVGLAAWRLAPAQERVSQAAADGP